jgi:sigma-E factor negative regulatory protein RseA
MDTKELSKEQISAFADGELSDAHAEVVLAALRTEQGLAVWNDYHLVGDAARSDETAVAMSPDFFSKFSARLEAEPTVIAPAQADRLQARRTAAESSVFGRLTSRRFAIPALALALVAAMVIILQPQPAAVVASAVVAPPQKMAGAAPVAAPAVTALVREGDVVRDPKIDQFLSEHERLSAPNGDQYSRSAAFNTDADK